MAEITGTPGSDTLTGDVGGVPADDFIHGLAGDDIVTGLAGADTLKGGVGDDRLEGGLGNDRILTGGGQDAAYGGAGDDVLYGGLDAGTAILNGGAGNDAIFARPGDQLIGGAGDDHLRTDFLGDCILSGGDGNDTLWGGGTLNGGAGDDLLLFTGEEGTLIGGEGSDDYSISAVTDLADVNIIERGTTGVDTLTTILSVSFDELPAFEAVYLAAEGTLTGNDADNTLGSLTSGSLLYGLGGDDTFVLSSPGASTVPPTATQAYGGDGNDSFSLTWGNGRMFGEGGRDTFEVTGDSAGFLDGGTGSDVMIGGAGRDELFGGGFAHQVDRMHGGGGRDTLHAGDTIDSFEYSLVSDSWSGARGRDTIEGFDDGQDRINLKAVDAQQGVPGNQAFDFIGSTGFTGQAGQLRFGASGADTLVQADTNGDGIAEFEILLTGALTLTAGDFAL